MRGEREIVAEAFEVAVHLFGLEFQSFRDRDGWFVCTDRRCERADGLALGDLAKELTDQAAVAGYQLFCGLLDDDQPDHQLFAIAGADACKLIRVFRVGSHNQGSRAVEDATVEAVFEEMRRIFEVRPFRPYFIDAAGYHCRFVGPLSREEAARIGELFHGNGEEWYASNWYEDTLEGFPEYVIAELLRENELHLWWD